MSSEKRSISFQHLDSDVPPLERQMRARGGQAKQGAECPAHPEVLFHAAGAEPEAATGLFVDDTLAFERLSEEGVHHFTEGVATPAHDVADPRGGVTEVPAELALVGV